MGYQIIPEGDGWRFAIFSSETETFVARKVERSDVVEFFTDIAVAQATNTVIATFEKIARGEPAYHQFTLTLTEAQERHAAHSPEQA